jgi:hypothetical protein
VGVPSRQYSPLSTACKKSPYPTCHVYVSHNSAFGEINLRWGILLQAMKFSLKMNCKIVDKCMRLHNFVVDHRQNNESFSSSVDREIFDDDCQRYFAVNPFLEVDIVRGGEDDVCRDADGNISHGGHSLARESKSMEIGKLWRDKHHDEIRRIGLVRPRSNWYRVNNSVFEH